MREYGVVRWNLGATKEEVEASKPYLGQARVQLGIMKNIMALGNQQQGARAVTLPDGTVIRSQSVMGQDTVQITPAVAAVAAVAARAAQPVAAEDNPRVRVAGMVNFFAAYWDYPSGAVVVSGIAVGSLTDVRMSHNARYIAAKQFVWDTLTGTVTDSGFTAVRAVSDYGVAAGSRKVDIGVGFFIRSQLNGGVETYSDSTGAIAEDEFYARLEAIENHRFAVDHLILQRRRDSVNMEFEHLRALENWPSPTSSVVETVAIGGSFGSIRGSCALVSRTGDVQAHDRHAAYVLYHDMYDGELDKVGAGDPADIVPLTQYYADPGRAVFITGVGTISDSYGPVALSANGRFAVVSMRKAFPVVEYYENATLPGVGGYFTGTSTAKNNAFTYGPFQYAVFNTDTGGYDVLINSEAEGDLACVDDSGQCYGNDSSGHAAKVFINGMRMLPGLFWVAGVTHDGLAVIGSLVDNSVDSFPAILIDGHIVGLPAGFRAVGSIASF